MSKIHDQKIKELEQQVKKNTKSLRIIKEKTDKAILTIYRLINTLIKDS